MVITLEHDDRIVMTAWNVITYEGFGTFHIAGFNRIRRRYLISTAICEIDLQENMARTFLGIELMSLDPRGAMHPTVLAVIDNCRKKPYRIAQTAELEAFKPKFS